MGWKESLQPASFRGVEFKVDTSDMAFGRRNETHEYPQRDIPYTEDLGQKAREYTVSAYVLGENYINQRDRLIEAIEKKEEPGTLIHPTLGSLLVVPKDCRVSFSNQEGGIERFQLTFVQAGENRFPQAAANTQDLVSTAGTAVLSELTNVLSTSFNVDNLPAFVTENASANVNVFAEMVEQTQGADTSLFGSVLETVTSFKGNVSSLVTDPKQLSEQTNSLLGGIRTSFSQALAAYRSLKRFTSYGANFKPVVATTSTRATEAQNQYSYTQTVQNAALVEMAKASAEIQFESYNDAVSHRDELAGYLDEQILAIGKTDDDPLLSTVERLRSVVVLDITQRAANLERVRTINTPATLPLIVIAYDLYEDLDRETDLINRNKIRHPGFVPGGEDLHVLVA